MTTEFPPIGEVKAFFPKHRVCVLKVMLLLVHCIMRCRTVNLNKCKSEAGAGLGRKDLKLPSVYTRFVRFFRIKDKDSFCFGMTLLLLSLLHLEGPVYLVIDRTNWEIGKAKVNVLCLGLLLPNGTFIPIIWENLPKKGNSSQAERLALLSRFEQAWPCGKGSGFTLLGDREFVGQHWFTQLAGRQMNFVVRLRRQDHLVQVAEALGKTIYKTEKHIRQKVAQNGFFRCRINMEGHVFYFFVLPNTTQRRKVVNGKPADPFVILLSVSGDLSFVSQAYRKRWGIEVFFLHCKTNGFNLEDLNLKDRLKAQQMVGLVALAYCLAIIEGLRRLSQRPQKPKKHGANPVSVFREGYDNLKNTLFQLVDLVQLIIKLLPIKPKLRTNNAKSVQ